MKQLSSLLCFAAQLASIVLLTGCGGGDDMSSSSKTGCSTAVACVCPGGAAMGSALCGANGAIGVCTGCPVAAASAGAGGASAPPAGASGAGGMAASAGAPAMAMAGTGGAGMNAAGMSGAGGAGGASMSGAGGASMSGAGGAASSAGCAAGESCLMAPLGGVKFCSADPAATLPPTCPTANMACGTNGKGTCIDAAQVGVPGMIFCVYTSC